MSNSIFQRVMYWIAVMYMITIPCYTIFAQSNDVNHEVIVNSIVLDQEIHFNVKNAESAIFTEKKRIKIINEKAHHQLLFKEYSDQFHKLDDAELKLFDSTGQKLINTFRLKDMMTHLAGSGLVADSKLYYFKIPAFEYPCIVEINYTIKYKGLLNYPTYYFIEPEQYVASSSYKLEVPKQLDVQYKAYHTNSKPTQSNAADLITYKWELTDLKPILYEEESANMEQLLPRIEISPSQFKMDEYEGEMNTWQHFGKWYDTLAKDRRNLDDATTLVIRNIVANESTTIGKANLLYNYLQSNFRYISIQLGIGGFKPFSAQDTYKNKYGDCKALSNYMQACLAVVGIKSYQALINAGSDQLPIDPSFPHQSFNHVILCIPQPNDTLWLECTSKENEFNHLGSFTENRSALLITEDGGMMVHTPISNSSNNIFRTKSVIHLAANGKGSASVSLKSSGDFNMKFLYYLYENNEEHKLDYLVHELKFKQPDQYQIEVVNKTHIPIAKIDLSYENISDLSTSSMLFLDKSLFDFLGEELPKNNLARVFDYYFEFPYQKEDSTIYFLPLGYRLEKTPEKKQLISTYFAYDECTTYDEKEHKVIIASTFELKKHIVGVLDYTSMKESFNEIKKIRNEKVILMK